MVIVFISSVLLYFSESLEKYVTDLIKRILSNWTTPIHALDVLYMKSHCKMKVGGKQEVLSNFFNKVGKKGF